MGGVALHGLLVVLLDVLLSSSLWLSLFLLEFSSCGGLAGAWAFGAGRWALLRAFASVLTDGKPSGVLQQFVVLQCLFTPVYETGLFLRAPASESYTGPFPDVSTLLVGSASSAFACAVWEIGLCGEQKKKNANLDANKLLARVLIYYKPDALYLIAAFTFLILGVICDTYIPFYEGKLIDMISGQGPTHFASAVGLLILFSVGSSLFSGFRGGIFMCSLARLNKRLKHLLFQSLLQQEMHFFEENKPGRLSSRLHSDIDRMGRTVALNANVAVRSTVKTCLMLRVMLGLSWELTLLTCIEMPLLAMIQNKYITLNKELKEQTQECHADIKDLASQTIGGIRTVRSFRAEEEELRRYHASLEQLCSIKRRSGVYGAVYLMCRRMVSLGIKLIMLIQARSLISSGQLSIGSLLTFYFYQKPMSVNLREIMFCRGETMSTVGVIAKVLSYLDRRPKCKKEGDLCPEKLEGKIVFQDVSFSYPSAPPDQLALKSVSIELQPGKITGLVGLSGNGKTTCVSLLKRLYEPQEGEILLDGEPLHLYQSKYLHQKIALVSQNPVLFSGSIRANIVYGLKDCPPEKVEAVAKNINAHSFISEMEDGYETDVGECGGKLAAGQKQIIAVIRALIRDPQVIILDEATSKLDIESQHTVLKEVLAQRRTVLIVTHQLKILEKADHIIFLEQGSVVEEGTHQELMDRKGHYYRLKEELFSQSS